METGRCQGKELRFIPQLLITVEGIELEGEGRDLGSFGLPLLIAYALCHSALKCKKCTEEIPVFQS